MEHITVKNIVEATGGRLLCGDENTPVVHISIDSRTMKGQDLFVPIVGEKVDAHKFIPQVFPLGAVAVLTSEHDSMEDTHAWIRVEDTKKALQNLGSYYRKRLSLPLVGITGSVGKTTTREMVAAALSAKYKVYKTPENSNSQVGLPITLSEITHEDEIGVLELGMSMAGELTVIAKIAMVDVAVITNVGVTHIEQLGSQENIYREKLTIQDGLKEGGVLFLNGDDPLLKETKAKAGCHTIYYGTEANSEYRAENISLENGFPVFQAVCKGKAIPVRLSVMGRHNVQNAMAALAVADYYGVDLNQAAKSLEGFCGFKNRQKIYHCNQMTVIDDTYNASPVSMQAGLETLQSMEGVARKIAVLADMKELGPDAPGFHRAIGIWMKDYPVDVLFTLGVLSKEIQQGAIESRGAKETFHFREEDREGLYQRLQQTIKPGDCILLKGSNSMKLGEVAARLIKAEK